MGPQGLVTWLGTFDVIIDSAAQSMHDLRQILLDVIL